MTEGTGNRSKRLGARFFKNPPQPHMCIRDYLKESWHACYINVLSWDKIEMATCPSDGLRLYGGMKINPPRTENPQSAVFFVMANPEILRRNGKNAQDLKEQSSLIELLLDFVEAMNEGVVFKRLYQILDDRDITGELKEIWSIVQSDKAKAQDTFVSEDVMRPVPQYQPYQDHTQNQQKHQQQQQQPKTHHQQQPQQYRQPPPQQHQHQLQQMQTQHQQPQPPQYHYNYSLQNRGPVDKCDNYDLSYTRQNQIGNNSQNDHIYQLRPVTSQNDINFRDRMYKHHYQQLPRPMGPPYPTPNCHPNPNLGCPNMVNPGIPPVINHGVNPGPQIHYVSMHALENNVFVELHRMQQPQQPQLQLAHAPPVRRYETIDTYYDPQANVQMNFMNMCRPQTNAPMKYPFNKRPINSPSHVTGSHSAMMNEKYGMSKSPVKVLQNDSTALSCNKVQNKQISEETVRNVSIEKKMVQVTDLDEDEPKGHVVNDCDGVTKFESGMELKKSTVSSCELGSAGTESYDNSSQQSTSVCNVFGRDHSHKKQGKTKIMVLKRNNSCNDGSKTTNKDGKAIKNGATCDIGSQHNCEVNDKGVKNEILESENTKDLTSGMDKNGYTDKKQIVFVECLKGTSNNKRRTQKIDSSTSTIINNEQSGHFNGQPKNNGKENDGVFHQVYTILKKPESISSQEEEVTNEIAQLSMKECTDSSEIGAVLS